MIFFDNAPCLPPALRIRQWRVTTVGGLIREYCSPPPPPPGPIPNENGIGTLFSEMSSEACQTSKMDVFAENS